MSRFTDAVGPKPLTWILCGRSRIAAVVERGGDRALVFLHDWRADRLTESLMVRDGGLWEEYGQLSAQGVPRRAPTRVAVAIVGCSDIEHGQHQLDGARLARRALSATRRVDILELSPRGVDS